MEGGKVLAWPEMPFGSKRGQEATDLALFVRTSDEEMNSWDRQRIVDALIRETFVDTDTADRISLEVERQILSSGIQMITAPLIRELVDARLVELGLEKARRMHTRLGMPLYDVDQLIFHPNKENANVPHSPEATNLTLAEQIKKEYALLNVFSPQVADAHLGGDLHVHDLGFIDRPYSFYRNETVTVKKRDGQILSMTFERLYNSLEQEAINQEGYEIKSIDNLEVLDAQGFVPLKRVVRHESYKKLLSITTENGKTVIVTEDHPFIKLKEKFLKIFCPHCKDGRYIVKDGNRTEETRTYWCKNCGKRFRGRIQKPDLTQREVVPALEISLDDFVLTPTFHLERIENQESFDEEMAWFLGYFIAEGFYGKNEVTLRAGEKDLERTKQILIRRGMKVGGDHWRIRVYSKSFQQFLSNVCGIGQYAQNKTMPFEFLNLQDILIGCIISGIVDGDGTIKSDNYVSEINIRLTSKALLSQIQLWLELQKIRNQLSFIDAYGERIYQGRKIESKLPLFLLRFYLKEADKQYFKSSTKIGEHLKYSKRTYEPSEYSKVRKIKEIRNDSDYVYDITTKTGTFICSGILVHNCSGQSLEYVKKFGLDLPGALSIARPARQPEVLLAHIVKFAAALQGHFAGAIGWDAVNVFFAPYLVGLSDSEVRQLAQMLIFEFSQQALSRGGQVTFSDLNLYWEIPRHFEDVPAIGPGGQYTGKTYREYEKEAQAFAWALFDVYLGGDGSGRPFFFPKPLLHLTEKFFESEGHLDFLHHVCHVASEKGNPYFVFDRGDTAKISQCCRLSFKLEANDYQDAREPWRMRYCALQNVTINLPRLGYLAKGDDVALFARLSEMMELAAQAHMQKRVFIEKLLAMGEEGPLALLTMKRDGEPYLRLHRSTHLIGMLGLNELIEIHKGEQLHQSEEAFKLGLKIISHMRLVADKLSQRHNLRFILEQSPAESVCHRLAKLDLKYHCPGSGHIVKGNISTGEVYYTNSTLFNVGASSNPIERVKREGLFHPLIPAGSISHLWLGESRPSAESLANFVVKVFRHTQNDQIAFSPEFTTCNQCSRTSRGLHSRCPACGSEQVDGITRITGYFTKVSSWNKGKLGELKERFRYSHHF